MRRPMLRGTILSMLVHPRFDPVALQLGPVAIHWYGLTYLLAFGLFMWLARLRLRHPPYASAAPGSALSMTARDVEDLLFFGVVGVVVGGRLGYCLFYKPSYYLQNPLEILAVWQGGMAFHGGMLGVIVAMLVFARLRGKPWLAVTDFIAPCVPTGLAAGRLGNFINGELWGRTSDASVPWLMVFPQSGSLLPRHPSQLYQLALEGLLLFAVLWWLARGKRGADGQRRARPLGFVSGAFLLGYGALRFLVEFFRQPDSYLGLLAAGLSMGQWLCVPMLLAGAALLGWSLKRPT
jgi:phosphatidylglycerol---prolipoprotein diacylglyceryl transferase